MSTDGRNASESPQIIRKRRRRVVDSSPEPDGPELATAPVQVRARPEPTEAPELPTVHASSSSAPRESLGTGAQVCPTETAQTNPEADPAGKRPSRSGPLSQEPRQVIHAARQWLRAKQAEGAMVARLGALKFLSKSEVQRFVDANKIRKSGVWCFEVLDERIEARRKEAETAAAVTGQLGAEGALPQPSAPVTAAACDDQLDEAEELPLPAMCPAEPAKPAKPSAAKRGRRGVGRPGSNSGPRVRTDVQELEPGATPKAEPQHREAPRCGLVVARDSTGRRRFAPQRAGSKGGRLRAGEATRWVPQISPAFASGDSGQPQCSHERRDKPQEAGCCWVCLDCGEVLWYDGWKKEFQSDNAFPGGVLDHMAQKDLELQEQVRAHELGAGYTEHAYR